MSLAIVEGSSHPALCAAITAKLGVGPSACKLLRFPDGELQVEVLENARGADVYIVQGLHPPVGEHVFELLLMADAYRRAGASRITVVAPYVGYARQDRRARGRESLGAKLIAEMLGAPRIDRLVAVDLHAAAVEGFFDIPVEHLTAVPLLAQAAQSALPKNAVVISPDLGAVKLAERYAALLGVPLAIVHKTRLSGTDVEAQGLVGSVKGCAPVLVDDMVTTAGTVEAAARVLLAAGARPEVTVIATHALLVGPAVQRLSGIPIQRLVSSDSVPPPATPQLPHQSFSLGPLLAETIRRLHEGESLGELVAHR